MRNFTNKQMLNDDKKPADNVNKGNVTFTTGDYSYYSKVLKEPFNTVAELKKAEEAYYAKLKAKEDKAAQKKADAVKVEEAFKALNAARKDYKEDIAALTHEYSENLAALKKSFEGAKAAIEKALADKEEQYAVALKAFTEKYPEGYHLTLKDGDFETTISSTSSVSSEADRAAIDPLASLFNLLFNF